MSQPLMILGTLNHKKGLELLDVFASVGLAMKTLAEVPEAVRPEETGETFAQNAAIKAVEQSRHLRQWVLGEDSGLRVDALDGEPGVRSARFSGENAADPANNRLLLDRLGNLPLDRRTAHYVCHMTLCDPTGAIRAESEGVCGGRILFAPRGEGGFGYDPLFEVVEYHRSFGELGPLTKSVLSHRARAARQLVPQLIALVDGGEWRSA